MKKFSFKKNDGPNNKLALRFGTFTVVVALISIVLLIGVNLLTSLLCDRLPIDIDLSSQKENSISEENLKIIKKVDHEVDITVCANESEYLSGMEYYAENMYQSQDSTGTYKYFQQTVNLIKEYSNYNKNIKVDFIDVSDTGFQTIASRYPTESFVYGSVIVESVAVDRKGKAKKDENGNKIIESHKTISFNDIYEATDQTGGYAAMGYGYKTITGNNIETALTSAIYAVTETETEKVAILSGHGDSSYLSKLNEKLNLNNYEVTEISDKIITKIPDDVTVVAIAETKTDYTAAEIKVLEDFLNNGGKKGKTVMFFASLSSPELPNLYAFLDDWGIVIDNTQKIYETDVSAEQLTKETLFMQKADSQYVESVDDSYLYFLASNLVSMSQSFKTKGKKTCEAVLNTSETSVKVPAAADENYDTSNLSKGQNPTVLITKDSVIDSTDDDYTELSSYVIAYASVDIVSTQFMEYSDVGNLEITLATLNSAVGRAEDAVYFAPKTITTESFSDKVTTKSTNIIKIVFLVVLPLAVVALGFTVIIRRKRR